MRLATLVSNMGAASVLKGRLRTPEVNNMSIQSFGRRSCCSWRLHLQQRLSLSRYFRHTCYYSQVLSICFWRESNAIAADHGCRWIVRRNWHSWTLLFDFSKFKWNCYINILFLFLYTHVWITCEYTLKCTHLRNVSWRTHYHLHKPHSLQYMLHSNCSSNHLLKD